MKTTLTHEEPFEGRTSTELALGCFALGTLYFIICLTQWEPVFVLLTGFIFIVMATILNGIMFYHLLYHYYILPQRRKYIGQKILILLANIPVAFLYYSILFYLNNNNSPF